jgi:hypothetical protein
MRLQMLPTLALATCPPRRWSCGIAPPPPPHELCHRVPGDAAHVACVVAELTANELTLLLVLRCCFYNALVCSERTPNAHGQQCSPKGGVTGHARGISKVMDVNRGTTASKRAGGVRADHDARAWGCFSPHILGLGAEGRRADSARTR